MFYGGCRTQRKVLHVALQSSALLTMYVGATFAYLSHSLKWPAPTPNFYSTHSWLGVLTLGLATAQVQSIAISTSWCLTRVLVLKPTYAL